MSLQTFFIGLITILIGVGLVMKTEPVLGFSGRIYWAEKWLGTFGGTRLAIKLMGLITIFIGMLMSVGLLGTFLTNLIRFIF